MIYAHCLIEFRVLVAQQRSFLAIADRLLCKVIKWKQLKNHSKYIFNQETILSHWITGLTSWSHFLELSVLILSSLMDLHTLIMITLIREKTMVRDKNYIEKNCKKAMLTLFSYQTVISIIWVICITTSSVGTKLKFKKFVTITSHVTSAK